ncbi:type II toxin-antitoxin system VapB family antitoxin [Nevskia ramosa]|uniref:type II toxin-antitoxin system VapB family antitoxin n=1 Tax=Nevskia ramosa TaxID=64002 RepID=UPI0003B50E92|nr:type II toxin-antitoxin system VapB family antitoxin [Nevskia ramosa]
MRTNIVLDDKLVSKAMKLSQAKTKRDVVNLALKEYVESRERKRILEMFGSDCIDPTYDYKAARAGQAP